uniref:Transposon Ty3-I Gag-Pol polyprotein n=1 Tax=Tanacetum cinerariifolium TaxID=118510 RepID=A0A6L2JMR2_TANCI|nr:transposon Ty3-I Gag-Pol polyprotein [Tanacetum cinerariifolium]
MKSLCFKSNNSLPLLLNSQGASTRYKWCKLSILPIRVVSIGAFIDLMDEQTVRGWLKEQQDRAETLAQQQTAAFQRQLDTLHAELQATRGLMIGRPGGGGDPGLLLLRSMRLDVPKFTREDPDKWIFAIKEYFSLLNTIADQRLRIVGFNLEGATAKWFRWMSRNGLITDWDRFVRVLGTNLGLPNMKTRKRLCQSCYNLVPSRSTNLHIQRKLLVSKPTTLGDVFALARITEARLDDQATSVDVTATKSVMSTGGQRQPNTRFGVPSSSTSTKPALLPTPSQTTVTTNPKPLAIKWISPAERQDREDAEAETDTTTVEAVESDDISILNSLIEQGSPRSLQLWGSIGPAFKVYIGNGESLLCENCCLQVMLSMQGLSIEFDLYVLPMKGPDVGEETLRMKRISLHHMQTLLGTEDVYGVYELHKVTNEAEGVDTSSKVTESIPPEIEPLLDRFSPLFQVPTTLPPHRVIDYRIHLLPNTKPVNVRPYRYPHYQKGEMEKLVTEMLAQGIIRFSQIPFSSPVLLAKKKDESYRFCVDYQALNAVTVKDKFPIPTADEMFDELGGAVIFTKLDLRAGYHQIRVHERDVYKTAFCTYDGHYEILVMPFGLTNALSTFQATMYRLFSPYLSKCAFGATTLEYLGHIISGHGVKVDPKKVDVIREWPVPMTQRQGFGEVACFASATRPRNSRGGFLASRRVGHISRSLFYWKEIKIETSVLCEYHDTPNSGHGGVKKMMVGLATMFYWRGMRKSVEEYIKNCRICQQTKYSTQAVGGHLQPLAMPSAVWKDVFMDFITGMPLSKGFTVVLVVVNRFSKYAHFAPLTAGFNAHKVAEVFVETVIKLHGIPKTIVSGRDPIFVSKFWTQLFKLSGTQLNHSTAYHPETDGQTEVVPLAIIPYPSGSFEVASVDDALCERDIVLRQLKHNLLAAKNRMEQKANRKRREVEYKVGDRVFLKLQPYRQLTLAKRLSNKLAKRYYGPYEILDRIGKVAYRLALPVDSRIHPVFPVSILKPFSGIDTDEVTALPEEVNEGRPLEQPVAICGSRSVLHNGQPKQQVLVQWAGRSPEEATREGLTEFQSAYPTYDLGDKVIFKGRENDTPKADEGLRRTTRESVAPAWHKDYVLR